MRQRYTTLPKYFPPDLVTNGLESLMARGSEEKKWAETIDTLCRFVWQEACKETARVVTEEYGDTPLFAEPGTPNPTDPRFEVS